MQLSAYHTSFNAPQTQTEIAPLLFNGRPDAAYVADTQKPWYQSMEGAVIPAFSKTTGEYLGLKGYVDFSPGIVDYSFDTVNVIEQAGFIKELMAWGLKWQMVTTEQVELFLSAPMGTFAQADAFNTMGSELLSSLNKKLEQQQIALFAAGEKAGIKIGDDLKHWHSDKFAVEIGLETEAGYGQLDNELLLRLNSNEVLATYCYGIDELPNAIAQLYHAFFDVISDVSFISTSDNHIDYRLDCYDMKDVIEKMDFDDIEHLDFNNPVGVEEKLRDKYPLATDELDDMWGDFDTWYLHLTGSLELMKYQKKDWLQPLCPDWHQLSTSEKIKIIKDGIEHLGLSQNPCWQHPRIRTLQTVVNVFEDNLRIIDKYDQFDEAGDRGIWDSRVVSYDLGNAECDLLDDLHNSIAESGERGSIALNLKSNTPFEFLYNIMLGEWALLAMITDFGYGLS